MVDELILAYIVTMCARLYTRSGANAYEYEVEPSYSASAASTSTSYTPQSAASSYLTRQADYNNPLRQLQSVASSSTNRINANNTVSLSVCVCVRLP